MANEEEVEMFKAVITFATLSIKSIILVNGAAVIALLTFFGNIWDKGGSSAIIAAAGSSLGWFILGLGLGIATAGLSYVIQVVFVEIKTDRARAIANRFRIFAVLLAACGLACFALGAFQAHQALLIPPPAAGSGETEEANAVRQSEFVP